MSGRRSRRRRFAAVIAPAALLLCTALVCRADPPEPAPEPERTVRFGGDRDFPPFEWLDVDGTAQGFQVELVRAIAAKMNLDVEVQLSDWATIREEFFLGAIDVVGMFDAPPRPDMAVFGDPHSVAASEIFIRHGEGEYRSLEDLRGKRVIVQAGGLAADRFGVEALGVELVPVATESDALRLLASGAGDAAVVTQRGGRGAMARFGLTNLTTTGPPVLESNYALCVRPGNEELLDKLNQGLAILKRTGEYNALYDKWFGDVDRSVISMRRVALYSCLGVGAVALYVLSSLVWTRMLQGRVEERTRQLRAELGERARVQAELERSERRFRELIEHAPEAILVIDPRGGGGAGAGAEASGEGGGGPGVTAANSKAQQLFGLTREQLLSADPRDLVGADVEWTTLKGADPTGAREVRVRRDDGTEVDCELRVARLPDAGTALLRASLVDVSERKRAERRQRILIDELDHRVKNTLASVIGLSEGLVRTSGSLAEFREAFIPRVHAMARAHEALAESKWEGVQISHALKLVLRSVPENLGRRVTLTGDDPVIGPERSLAVCLVFHELAVNSIVHGALSRPHGVVGVRCELAPPRVRITWTEPADHSPSDRAPGPVMEGFGLTLVRGLVEHQLQGRVRFERTAEIYFCEFSFEAEQRPSERTGGASARPAHRPAEPPGAPPGA